jgi:hypothetical protein
MEMQSLNSPFYCTPNSTITSNSGFSSPDAIATNMFLTNPPILTYTLEEVLTRFEQKMDKQFSDVNQKMDRQFSDVNQKFTEVNQKLEKIDERLNKLEIGQAELSEKASGKLTNI